MAALAVVLVACCIRLACLWQAMNDLSDLELGRGVWKLAAEVLPPVWIAGALLVGGLIG